MQPTVIGIAQLAIGGLLLGFGGIPATLVFVVFSGLMASKRVV